MEVDGVALTGRMGGVGVLVVVILWVLGWTNGTESLILGTTRTGQLSPLWMLLHGILVVGTALNVAIQRLPARQGVLLGLMTAFLSAVGVTVGRVVAHAHGTFTVAILVALIVVLFGLGATMSAAGALGGWIGSRFAPTIVDEPLVFEAADGAPEHLPTSLRERYRATRIAHAALEGGRGRLSTMESTVAFAWVEDMLGLDALERETLRWRGIEVDWMSELVNGRVPPNDARARLLDTMERVQAHLEADRVRSSYR